MYNILKVLYNKTTFNQINDIVTSTRLDTNTKQCLFIFKAACLQIHDYFYEIFKAACLQIHDYFYEIFKAACLQIHDYFYEIFKAACLQIRVKFH
jgi:hypothetical protein